MTNIIDSIKDVFTKKEPLPAGLYAYQTPQDADLQYRLHLRIEKDGSGLLVINASTILHLNQTAAEYAYHMIIQDSMESAVKEIAHRYKVDKAHVSEDYQDFQDKVMTLIQTPNLDPVMYLDIERQEPYTDEKSAPYRLDCALTYQVPDNSHHEHAPVDRVDRELTTDEWVMIFEKAFNNGIPHILFTGGEPTIREDLPELILKAEDLGLVTGLVTDGLQLVNDTYLEKLLVNGLDHLLIVFDPENPKEWDALKKVLAGDLFTTVHLTLKKGIDLHPHIQHLSEMGANAISLSESDKDLTDELQELRDFAAIQQIDLVWDMPVPYSKNNPVALELEAANEEDVPEGAGRAWLYVEPDGDVLPSQGMYNQVLGNMLTDSWEKIWESRQV